MDSDSLLSEQLLSDSDLVEDFRANQNSESLERIVVRYGALVMGVCRRHSRNQQDAEDAFQATFLIMVTHISRLRKPESIGSWLFGIAYRVSTRLTKKSARQTESIETQSKELAMDLDPFELVNTKFVLSKADEELQGLPEQLKRPMVLRYLMGKTNQEIASQLQTSVSAIEGRLKRAKRSLRLRLTRCGITLGTALIALHKSQEAAAGWFDTQMTNSSSFCEFDLTQSQSIPSKITQLAREETVMIPSILGGKTAAGIAASFALITTSVIISASTANGDGTGDNNLTSQGKSTTVVQIAQASNKKANPTAFDTGSANPSAKPSTKKTNNDDLFGFGNATSANHHGARSTAKKASSSDDPFDTAPKVRDETFGSTSKKASRKNDPFDFGGADTNDPFAASSNTGTPNASRRQNRRGGRRQSAQTLRSKSAVDAVQDMKVFSPNHLHVRRQLQKTTEVDFHEVPLGEALSVLKQLHGINMRVDKGALESVGVTIDNPVQNIRISEITLHECLDIMLEEFGLTFAPRGNLLFITSPEKANRIHETHVYRLPKLSVSPAELLELITSTVTPDLWDKKKGYGRITQLQDRIVVRQTFRGHQELQDLLKQLIQSERPENSSNPTQFGATIRK